MKLVHIILILVIAVAIGIIITSAGDSSTYVTFDQAHQMSQFGNKNSIHVVGELKKDEAGNIVGITPNDDRVSFSFIMVDDQKREQVVQYNQPMPPDFTKSEKVVVIGRYSDNLFVAEKILLKCPSKYQEEPQFIEG